MAESHHFSGLVTKHSEIVGRVQEHQQLIAELKHDIHKLVSAIHAIGNKGERFPMGQGKSE